MAHRENQSSFQPGNQMAKGFGRPKGSKDRITRLRHSVHECATPEDVRRVMNSMLFAATARQDKDGQWIMPDVAAARVWLEYAIGRPKQQIEIEGGQVVTAIQLMFDPSPPAADAEVTAKIDSKATTVNNGNGHHRLPAE